MKDTIRLRMEKMTDRFEEVGRLLAGTALGLIGLAGTAVLLFVYISSVGCLFPNTTALAMAPHGAVAGSASALLGTVQFVLGAVRR